MPSYFAREMKCRYNFDEKSGKTKASRSVFTNDIIGIRAIDSLHLISRREWADMALCFYEAVYTKQIYFEKYWQLQNYKKIAHWRNKF